jgi:hypothetical protein
MSTMSGLRVYVNAPSVGHASGDGVADRDPTVNGDFYSRRGNGPIYRWRYEEKLAHWRASRMHTADFDTQKLSNATWKSVPETLQVQLGSHYLD